MVALISRLVAATACVVAVQGEGNALFPEGACDDDRAESKTCCDVSRANNAECNRHVDWAMSQGIEHHKKWYAPYGVKKETADRLDYQCALFWISWNKAEVAKEEGYPSEKHSCPRPCGASLLDHCAEPPPALDPNFDLQTQEDEVSLDVKTCPEKVAPAECGCGEMEGPVCDDEAAPDCEAKGCKKLICKPDCPSSSLSPWAIALIVLGLVACIGAAAYMLLAGKEKPKKKKVAKKRAVEAAPAPAPEPAPAPASFVVAPMVTTAAPVYLQQPMMQQQVVYQQAAPVSMFDALDRNGDGVITRAEMQGATVAQGAPQMMVQQPQMMLQQPQMMVQQPQMVQTTATPMVQYAAAPQMVQQTGQVSMFDMLDRNHDGVITRAEFR